MKSFLNLTFLLLLPFLAVSQSLSDAKTYQKTIELAQKRQKPILLIINIKPSGEMAAKIKPNQAIKEEDVVKTMKANFIVFESEFTDTAMRKIIGTYKITNFPSFLFMHPSGDLFYKDFGYSSDKNKYLKMMDNALTMSKEKSMSDLAKAYEANKTDGQLIKQLINLRKKNGITDNSDLIEDYVNTLKVDDFNNYETILFILEAGPQIDGNAYKFSRTNMIVFNKIYLQEPLDKRIAINNAIIMNSYNAAVKGKNINKALQVASFVRGTWNSDYEKGAKAYESRMLSYYSAVKDTASYFRNAINFYDRYYMKLSADSIKKLDKKNQAENLERMKRQMPNNSNSKMVSKEKIDSLIKANPTQKITRTETMSVSSTMATNQYSNELNNIAYRFYQTGTKNINHLSKAMIWSKRAIELDPKSSYYDTLAHIYYAMGIHSEALVTQKLAMDLAKKENVNADYLIRATEAYEKMKSKTL
jgi:tetratricopeptide (TPR) repeat protein